MHCYQTAFKEYLLDSLELHIDLSHLIDNAQAVENKVDLQKRLAIYKNNMYFSLIEALCKMYPVVMRLVGENYFKKISRQFVQENPPLNPDISQYGESFPIFIAAHRGCQDLNYLPDVARLEWLCQRAFNAGDDAVLRPESLAEIDQEKLLNLKFKLHASACILFSEYPVDVIWHENLQVKVDEIKLNCGQMSHLLIYRKDYSVQVVNLKPKIYQLLRCFKEGKTIEHAWAEIKAKNLVIDEEFSEILAYLLGLEVFSQAFFDRLENDGKT